MKRRRATRCAGAAAAAVAGLAIALSAGAQPSTWYRLDAAHRVVEVAEAAPQGGAEDGWLRQDASGRLAAAEAPTEEATRAVELLVIAAATGAPVPGALVWTGSQLAALPPIERSLIAADERGRARLRVAEEDLVRVWAPGFESALMSAADLASGGMVVLRPGGAVEVRFVLPRSAAREAAPEAAPVEIGYRWAGEAEERWIEARVDGDGGLRVAGVGADRPLALRVTDPRFSFDALTLAPGEHRIALQAGFRLEGAVVDSTDRRLPDVEVAAYLPVPGERARLHRRVTRSGDAGRFRLDGLPEGRFLVVWRLDGHRDERRWVRAGEGAPAELAPVRLVAGRSLRVRVLGDEGPLGEASVVDRSSGERVAVDADGVVALAGQPADRPLDLRVEADGYRAVDLTVAPGAPSPVEVRLTRGRGFRVELRDLWSGEPVASLRTEIVGGGLRRFGDHAADDGVYHLTGLPDARLRAILRPPGYLPLELELGGGDGVADLGVLYLDPGASAEGTLIDLHGDPLVGARLTLPEEHLYGNLGMAALQPPSSVESDLAGRFRITGLTGGSRCVRVEHPKVATTVLTLDRLLPNEQRQLGFLTLGPGVAVAGTARDGERTPRPHLPVELRAGPLSSPCARLVGQTDAAGGFRFAGVAAGDWSLVARPELRLAAVEELAVEPYGDLEGVELVVDERQVEGQVLVGGVPVDAGRMEVRSAADGGFTPPAVFVQPVGLGAPRGRFVSDLPSTLVAFFAAGRFSGRGPLPAGEAELAYFFAGGDQVFLERRPVPDSTGRWVIDLVFEGVPVGGRVLSEDGEPLAGVQVSLAGARGSVRRTATGPDGGFTLLEVAPGSYRIEARAAGRKVERSLTVGEEPVEGLELTARDTPPASVVVELTDADGSPLPGALVYVTDGGSVHRFQKTGLDGRTRIAQLDPGEYSVALRAPDGTLLPGPRLDLRRGGEKRARLELPAEASPTLLLAERQSGREVRLLTGDGTSIQPLLALAGVVLRADATGQLQLPRLAEGVWLVDAGDGGSPRRLTLRPGDEEIDWSGR